MILCIEWCTGLIIGLRAPSQYSQRGEGFHPSSELVKRAHRTAASGNGDCSKVWYPDLNWTLNAIVAVTKTFAFPRPPTPSHWLKPPNSGSGQCTSAVPRWMAAIVPDDKPPILGCAPFTPNCFTPSIVFMTTALPWR